MIPLVPRDDGCDDDCDEVGVDDDDADDADDDATDVVDFALIVGAAVNTRLSRLALSLSSTQLAILPPSPGLMPPASQSWLVIGCMEFASSTLPLASMVIFFVGCVVALRLSCCARMVPACTMNDCVAGCCCCLVAVGAAVVSLSAIELAARAA